MPRVMLLARYSLFIKNNYLESLAEENHRSLSLLEFKMLKFCHEFYLEDLIKMSLINLTKFLSAFEEDKITEEVIINILKLELEDLTNVKYEHIYANDLLSIYTTQKQTIISFIPKFTTDINLMMELIKELEGTFLKVINHNLDIFINQCIESTRKISEQKVRKENFIYYNNKLKTINEDFIKLQEELGISYQELKTHHDDMSNNQQYLIIKQEDLVSREIELVRSNQYLEQFANMASHDLKEPLRMVKQYVLLVAKRLKENLDPDIKDFMDYIVHGVERMEHLIKSLLDYAKLNKMELPLEFTNSDLALEMAKSNLSVAIEESKADITSEQLPLLKMNAVQLTSIFQNLISNSIKFRSPDNLVKIHISVERKDHKWLFSVKDNSIGIKSYNLEKIFIPFQRIHSISEYEGIGLGLSFCKKIVQQYDGDMWVESEPGVGSIFFFTIMSKES